MEYSTRLLYKDKLHPEIYNSAIPMNQKLFLQERLESFGGDFDNYWKMLKNMLYYQM